MRAAQLLDSRRRCSPSPLLAMPAFRWLGLTWHLSSDALALAGAALLLIDVPALVVTAATLAVWGRPGSCHKAGAAGAESRAHLAVLWGLPALLILNCVLASAMVLVGCRGEVWIGRAGGGETCRRRQPSPARPCCLPPPPPRPKHHLPPAAPSSGLAGTPLTPSTRRCMGPVMYAQLAKWIAGLAFVVFSLHTVYVTPENCWASGRRLGVEVLLWTLVGVVGVVA